MVTTQTQIRRDTATNLNAATPVSGELAYDTSNKRLSVGDGTTAGGIKHASAPDIQKQSFAYGTVGGTANAITLTNSPVITSYVNGLALTFKATATNTSSTTVNVDGLGAKNIYKMVEGTLTALSGDEIYSGGIYTITYDGTQFQLTNVAAAAPTVSGFTLLDIKTGGGASYDFTTGIDSTYRNYLFIFNRIIPSSGTPNFLMRISRSGVSGFDSGGSDYLIISSTFNGTTATHASTTSDAAVLMTSNTSKIYGQLMYHDLAQAVDGASFESRLYTEQLRHTTTIGFRNTSTAIDAVQFLYASGNIDSGTIYMYGANATL